MSKIVVVGSFVQDLAFLTPQFPTVGETRIGTFFPGPGGKGFNQAVAAARLQPGTEFIGAVGNDVFSETARSFAKSVGLTNLLEVVEGESCGAASILVDENGDNQIVVSLGANSVLSSDWIKGNLASFQSSSVVLCQLEANLSAIQTALALGRESGAATILNLAPINQDLKPDLVGMADIVTPNETEFAFVYQLLTGKSLPSDYFETSDEELHFLCRELNVPVVVITLGKMGSFISVDPDKLPQALSLAGSPYQRFSCIEADAIDTSGAGDAFNGGLAAGLVRFGGDLVQAMKFASVVAGLSVEKRGTAPAMPTLAEVEARQAL
ncbi:ribokinase [Pelagicoccus albus]|uniref:Ribokinase n=1 Tax=Pelagicoccus albus TaxID=415222 RepID=A0A7X1B455_9BACT|nr:ribokinase [Pelagicoccus albus]MBC2605324.1 ribokinase [Pelagicoccus albus]